VKKCAVCSRIFRYGALYLNILKSEILSTILEQQACMVCYYLINLQNHLLYNSVVVLTYVYIFFFLDRPRRAGIRRLTVRDEKQSSAN